MTNKAIRRPSKVEIVNNYRHNQRIDKSSRPAISGILGPTIIIAILTSFFIFLNYQYSSAFFNRLSLPSRGIELPVNFFLNEIIYSFIFALIVIYFYLPMILCPEKFKDKKINYFLALATIVMAFIFPYILFGIPDDWSDFANQYYFGGFQFGFLINSLLIFIILIILVKYKELIYDKNGLTLGSLVKSLYYPEFNLKIIITIIIFMMGYSFIGAYYIGDYHAEKFIDQSFGKTFLITIDLKENGTIFHNESPLIRPFIMHYDSKYYLLDKDESGRSQIDIIPDDQIKTAKITTIQHLS
jgi:hypothetical protein